MFDGYGGDGCCVDISELDFLCWPVADFRPFKPLFLYWMGRCTYFVISLRNQGKKQSIHLFPTKVSNGHDTAKL